MNPAVVIEDVLFEYNVGSRRGVGPLSFYLNCGECLGVMGPSGCGKTTLLKLVAGLLPSSKHQRLTGAIRRGGPNSKRGLSRPDIGLMFQQPCLLPHKSVLDNVLLPLLPSGVSSDDRNRSRNLLVELGLTSSIGLLPEKLSGGMKTRVALARALVVCPSVLLLDEPFAGLDVAVRESAYQIIEKETSQTDSATILVTHDLEEAWRMCGRVVALDGAGRLHLEIEGVHNMPFDVFRNKILLAMKCLEK